MSVDRIALARGAERIVGVHGIERELAAIGRLTVSASLRVESQGERHDYRYPLCGVVGLGYSATVNYLIVGIDTDVVE